MATLSFKSRNIFSITLISLYLLIPHLQAQDIKLDNELTT